MLKLGVLMLIFSIWVLTLGLRRDNKTIVVIGCIVALTGSTIASIWSI